MVTARMLIEVQGMTCDDCARTVREKLEREPGVHGAEVAWPTGVALVSFDPGVTDEARILQARIFSGPSGHHRFRAQAAPGRPGCC